MKPKAAADKPARIPVYVGQRIVGAVVGDVFFKGVFGSRHFLRQPPGIALDIPALKQAVAVGARYIQVKDKETGKVYKAEVDVVLTKGQRIERGWGPQAVLPFEFWETWQTPIQLRLF